jgi:RNase adaptor protein for sRNA GlmZ degradation
MKRMAMILLILLQTTAVQAQDITRDEWVKYTQKYCLDRAEFAAIVMQDRQLNISIDQIRETVDRLYRDRHDTDFVMTIVNEAYKHDIVEDKDLITKAFTQAVYKGCVEGHMRAWYGR